MGKPHGIFLLSFLGLTISKVCLFPKFPMHFWSLQHGIMLDKPEDYHSSGNSSLCNFFSFLRLFRTPLQYSLPGKFHGRRSLASYSVHGVSKSLTWLNDYYSLTQFCYYVTTVPFMFVWKCNVPRWITHLIHFLSWAEKGLQSKKCSFEVQVIIMKENLIYCQQYKKYNSIKVSARIEGKEACHKGHSL